MTKKCSNIRLMQGFSRQTLMLALVFSAGLMASGSSAAMEVYKFVDSLGRVHFTDRPPHQGYKLIKRNGRNVVMARIDFKAKDANRKRFSKKIAEVAREHRVPEALLHAVITVESAYDPNAVSKAGAVGLMQLMPATARRYGVYNRHDPFANLTGGTRYLKDLIDRFDRKLELALAGYNAGENAVAKYGNQVPPYDETQNYVRKVLKLYSEHSVGVTAN